MFGRRKRAPDAPALRRAPMRLLPLGGAGHLVELLEGGRHRVSHADAQLLVHCGQFDALDTHANRFAQQTGADAAQTKTSLQALAEAGLLVDARSQLGSPGADRAPPISAISVITARRPDSALRCVRSMLECAAPESGMPELLVVDDSDDSDDIKALQSGLQALSKAHHQPIRLVIREDKRTWAEQLAQRTSKAVPTGLIDDALVNAPHQNSRCGASRNLQQLALMGRSFVSIDDDTISRFYAPPGATQARSISARTDPLQVWQYVTRDQVWSEHDGVAHHPIEAHDAMLGAPLADWLPQDADLNSLDDNALHTLSGGRLRASMAGAAGDCGMSATAYMLWNSGPSLDRLVADEPHYAATRFGRNMLRAALQPTATRFPLFMGACTGYDNSATLPPFVPSGRNADGVFGVTLMQCDPTAWIGHAALAIHHDPPDARPRDIDEALAQPAGLQHSNLLSVLIASQSIQSAPMDMALYKLGHFLLGLTAHEDSFAEHARVLATRSLAAHIRRLEATLDHRDGQPAWWARDIESLRTNALMHLTAPDAVMFPLSGASPSRRFAAVRAQWRNFGQLMIHWPAIRNAAAASLAEGDHPGRLL